VGSNARWASIPESAKTASVAYEHPAVRALDHSLGGSPKEAIAPGPCMPATAGKLAQARAADDPDAILVVVEKPIRTHPDRATGGGGLAGPVYGPALQ
jgi:hypothetical protein